MSTTEQYDTVVIGAGQAGLATGYHLARRHQRFVILEAHERIGDIWRNRFDGLRLYSPAQYDGLPGWGFPAKRWTFPTKDEVGDYFESYAARFKLPVRTGVVVDRLSRDGDAYLISAGDRRIEARNVVVASGTFQTPIVPDFARFLDPRIRQLHSHDYRNPSQLQDGPVLVVGAAHSGSDVALDVAATHQTTLAGKINGEIPFRLGGRVNRMVMPFVWLLAKHVLTVRTPLGRKMRKKVRAHGAPLLRVRRADLLAAGVEHTDARVIGMNEGRPELADGRVLDVTNVIWCTGFGKDVSFIDIPVNGADGWPEQRRGAVESAPGLYFVGVPFLQGFTSMLVGGVGRDAQHVAKLIASRRPRAAERAARTARRTADRTDNVSAAASR